MNLSTHKKSEVELRVAQELKNNQDFIYQTNQKLQSLGQGMIALSIQNEKLKAQMDSDKKDVQIDQENHMKNVEDRLALVEKKIGDVQSAFEFMLDETHRRMDKFFTSYARDEDVQQKFDAISKWMEKFQTTFDSFVSTLLTSYGLVDSKIAYKIDGLRKELTPDLKAVNPLKKEVEDLLDSMRVDFQGLIREIALIKKDVAYGEKKFENIYTLIERLKAGKV